MASERTQGWVDGVVCRLIRRAARRAPRELSGRLEEEWQADLAERRGPLSRLRFAIGCCWAINVIAREHGLGAVQAAGVSAGNAPAACIATDDPPFLSTRTTTFLLVVCLHVALVYGLAMGLGATLTKAISGPFIARVIEKPRQDDPPPVPHQKFSTETTIDVPPPEVPPLEGDDSDVVHATVPEKPQVVLPTPSVPAAVDRVQGGPGAGFPNANDFYPDIEIRRGGEGVATVKACVNAKGRLISEPTIIQSTGSAGLDQAALKLARAGSGHYRASTENARPVDSCYPFRIRFELRN